MDFTKVTKFLESLGDVGVPGTDMAIFLKGKEVYRQQHGYADIEAKKPFSTDTLLAIWSMSKVITCTAALRLYEEGRYLMHDPLYEYMPEFKETTYKDMHESGHNAILPCKRHIRIIDLFTMCAGFSYDMPERLAKAADTAVKPDLRHFMYELAKEPLCFEPGTHYRYGVSHDVLGALVEVLSGKPFGEYLRENIFAPLGMDGTCFYIDLPEDKAHRLASVYTFDENTRKNEKITPSPLLGNWKAQSGGGGLVSTVDDYSKFATALCAGGTTPDGYRLLGKATVDLMRTGQLDGVRLEDYRCSINNSYGYSYGLGVRTMVDKAHGGSGSNVGEFGWSGALGTYVLMDPAAELTYVYAQQLMPSLEEWVAPRLRNVVYGCL